VLGINLEDVPHLGTLILDMRVAAFLIVLAETLRARAST